MAVKKVDLYVTQLIEDLNNGLTWSKKDDLGYGSIEVKYGANEKQIAAIRKHPLLKDAETNIVIFNIIDDTKTTTTTTIKTTEPDIVPMADLRTKSSVSEELEAFANL
jgi:basic membrane lipoprotein Med (substrate-binding protein (PBP1-ABC) superfamily)